MPNDPVKVHLLDREFLVACSDDERAGLVAAADLMDQRMRELRNQTGNPGFDRLAVLVALNITHEYLGLMATSEEHQQQLGGRLDALTHKLQQALDSADGTAG